MFHWSYLCTIMDCCVEQQCDMLPHSSHYVPFGKRCSKNISGVIFWLREQDASQWKNHTIARN